MPTLSTGLALLAVHWTRQGIAYLASRPARDSLQLSREKERDRVTVLVPQSRPSFQWGRFPPNTVVKRFSALNCTVKWAAVYSLFFGLRSLDP